MVTGVVSKQCCYCVFDPVTKFPLLNLCNVARIPLSTYAEIPQLWLKRWPGHIENVSKY